MDDLQQRIIDIALQIPGYLGYEAKERRRDMDKYTRGQLTLKYDGEHTHLSRVARSAPLANSVGLENLDQKLQRLIARFNTAPRGYAGWFDSAQIVDEDLDALTHFDAALANGAPQLKSTIDQIAAALKAKQGVEDAVSACAELLDTLNAQFDQREQLLATGKKPSLDIFANLASPLDALKAKQPPPAEFSTLADLKMNDAVSYGDTDFIVSGKITYNVAAGKFHAFLLKDRDQERWLRVGPEEEIAMCKEMEFSVPDPLPDSVKYDNQSFAQAGTGTANVTVEGAGGTKRGQVSYARYRADDNRIWVENFGNETRAMLGNVIEAGDLKVYRR
jgi:hypothetical protein